MRLLWLCNVMPGAVRGNGAGDGLWMDHVLEDLRREGLTVRVLCAGEGEGSVDERLSFGTFREPESFRYYPELRERFRRELRAYRPDVIHVWGTEYGHTLAMMSAAWDEGFQEKTVVSIQGLCTVIARHYCQGLPFRAKWGFSLRDLLRLDNVALQQRKFRMRGILEEEALEQAIHVIGRTRWDEAHTREVNPDRVYHFCNETLRPPFYAGRWRYEACRKHRIFVSSCEYPIKGFHDMLEAFRTVLEACPDATLAVTGENVFQPGLRRTGYHNYLRKLAETYGISDKIEFLGRLSGEQMKQAFLDANVFCLPSAVENSPNSLGEAMLLGVPCVAADVGGVTQLMKPGTEGYAYPSGDTALLARHILNVFEAGARAEVLGEAARAHALKTHDPETNLHTLLEIYHSLK